MDPWKPKGYVCRSFDWENSIVSFNEAPRFDKLKQGNTRVLSSPLDLFLDLSVDSPRHSYEAPEIYASCSEHITNLQHDGEGAPGSLAVWMDDRSKSRGPRNYNGPMTIKDWLERLKLKRLGQEGHPDAETRRMYIPNPDAWTLGTLILKANKGQALVLRDCLRRHLDGEASIKARFPGRFFVLEFHLPFIVWQKQARQDGRKKADKRPLRNLWPLSFLSKSHGSNCEADQNTHGFLHDAQFSFVVMGHNNSNWTAWALADTYFYDQENGEDNKDMLAFYDGVDKEFDPLIRKGVDTPIWDPREYFLVVLRTRLKQIAKKWRAIIYEMKSSVEDYANDPHIGIPPERFSLGTADEKAQAVRNSYRWVKELKRVLNHLIKVSSRSTAAFNSFVQQDIGYFSGTPEKLGLSLHDIIETFSDLRDIEAEVNNMDKMANDITRQLELYLLVDGNCAIVLQQWNVTIIHFLAPPTLAAGIVQAEIVPHVLPPFMLFLILTALTGLLTWAAQPALTYAASRKAAKIGLQQGGNNFSGQMRSKTWPHGFEGNPIALPKPTFFGAGTIPLTDLPPSRTTHVDREGVVVFGLSGHPP